MTLYAFAGTWNENQPEANNPPPGLKVVIDDGQVLSKGFGE